MCGIAAYFGKKEIPKINYLNSAKFLFSRGPDNTSFFFDKKKEFNTGLIHTRLSIIDLNQRANQPFYFKNYVLIFNGEIYNYLELKNILISKGYNFYTKSDTEVLLKSFDCWGKKAFSKFQGMWSIIIYDKKKQKLIVSRDCFGEKPLFLFRSQYGFYLASNIKALIALVGKKFNKNIEHLKRYMVNGYKSIYKTKQTFFKDIEEFPKNTVASTDKNFLLNKSLIWKPNINIKENIKYDEAVSNIRELLINSVKIRTRSDVKLSYCLSGGVDSNSLIGIAKKKLNLKPHAFSIINSDPRFEENQMINLAIKDQNLKCNKIYINKKNFLEKLKKQVLHAGRPIYTISYYLQNFLMKKISSKEIKVSLSGTGADEIFTGYYDHYNLYAYQTRKNREYNENLLKFWSKNIKKYVRNPHLKDLKLYYKNKNFRDHIYFKNDLFSSFFHDEWQENFKEKFYTSDILKNRMLNELFHESVPVILSEDDNNAMSYSIENRSPYLDIPLLNYVLNLPSIFFMKNGIAKSLLRDAMKGIVNNKILFNPRKVGFNSPIDDNIDLKKNKDFLLDNDDIFKIVKSESA